jgi:hypothetical protein
MPPAWFPAAGGALNGEPFALNPPLVESRIVAVCGIDDGVGVLDIDANRLLLRGGGFIVEEEFEEGPAPWFIDVEFAAHIHRIVRNLHSQKR